MKNNKKINDFKEGSQFTEREKRDLDEIACITNIDHTANEFLKTKGIDLKESFDSNFTTTYNNKLGKVIFTYVLKGLDDRQI